MLVNTIFKTLNSPFILFLLFLLLFYVLWRVLSLCACGLQGALALEDALSQGLPIEKEIHSLHTYLEGDAKDPLLDLVLSSIPKETQSKGTDTILQLKHKASFLVVCYA